MNSPLDASSFPQIEDITEEDIDENNYLEL